MIETFQELLDLRGRSDSPWLVFPKDPERSDDAVTVTFREMVDSARAIGATLEQNGAEPGGVAIVVADNNRQFPELFFGAMLAGLVPTPVHPPLFSSSLDVYHENVRRVVRDCSPQFALLEDGFAEALEPIRDLPCSMLEHRELVTSPGKPRFRGGRPHDPAFIQYSSGSTRTPLGATLSHANALWNVEGIGRALNVAPDHVALCWLPLFHDMGLTGTLIYSFYWGMPIVLMAPLTFVAHPSAWLWAISRFRVVGAAAPNFAFALCASERRVSEASLAGLDLSRWLYAMNGAEQVQESTVAAFVDRFGKYGFRREAMLPVYGLSENALAACFPKTDVGPSFDHVSRASLAQGIRAEPARNGEPMQSIASVGTPLLGQEVRVSSAGLRVLEERVIGEIEVRGACIMSGYWGNREASAATFTPDGWLRTGDRGYLLDGNLHVVGRSKEIIKRGGVKLNGADLQHAVGTIEGVRAGCVAVFGVASVATGTEELVIIAETKLVDSDALASLRASIGRLVRAEFGQRPDAVVLISPGMLPKTTSGKVMAERSRELYAAAEFVDLGGGSHATG